MFWELDHDDRGGGVDYHVHHDGYGGAGDEYGGCVQHDSLLMVHGWMGLRGFFFPRRWFGILAFCDR